jgi:outer membrane lipoprotein carrier protein
MMRLILCSLAAFFWVPSFLAQSQNDSAGILRKIDDHYNHLSSLKAHYTERYSGMGLERVESGTLLLRKPGKMRWSYDTPSGKLFVLDGKYAWFYTPGDAQIQRTPAKQLDDLRSPLRFLLGHTQINKELTNISVTSEANGFVISGIPKGMEQRIRLLTLWTSPAGLIQDMKIDEVDGSVTEFSFTSQQENVSTRAEDFIFVPPQDIPVVDALPPV